MHPLASTLRYVLSATAAMFLLSGVSPAGTATQPAPTTQPAATRPAATQPVEKLEPVDPQVRQVLERSLAAYRALETYQDLGTISTQTVVAGRKAATTMPASTTFKRPGRFISNYDTLSLYSDGESVWLYAASQDRFLTRTQADLGEPGGDPELGRMLRNFPMLWVLLRSEQSLLAIRKAGHSQYLGTQAVGDRTCDHVRIAGSAASLLGWQVGEDGASPTIQTDLYIDTQTRMLARLAIDMTQLLRRQVLTQDEGNARIEQALWQFDAGQVWLDRPVADETFAFTAPARAEPVEQMKDLFLAEASVAINDEEMAEEEERRQANLPFEAIDFALQDLSGRTVKLRDLRGRVVLLDFWATWCPPCRAELPHLQKIHDDLADKGLVVLAINIAEDEETAKGFIEEKKYTFTVLLDEIGAVGVDYGVDALPTVYLIDRSGMVVKRHTGYGPGAEVVLRKEIENLLKAAAEPAAASQPAGADEARDEEVEPDEAANDAAPI